MLKRIDDFLDKPLLHALKEREQRADRVLELDDALTAVVSKLMARVGGAPADGE